jgi:hypothetical protein
MICKDVVSKPLRALRLRERLHAERSQRPEFAEVTGFEKGIGHGSLQPFVSARKNQKAAMNRRTPKACMSFHYQYHIASDG